MARLLCARHKHAIAYCPRTEKYASNGQCRHKWPEPFRVAVETRLSMCGGRRRDVAQTALVKVGARIGPNAFERQHICIGHSPVPFGCGLVGFRLINWRTSGRRVTIPVPRGKKSRPTMFYNAKQSQSGLKISWKHARTSRTLLFPLL